MFKRVCIFTNELDKYEEFEECQLLENENFYKLVDKNNIQVETLNKLRFEKTKETDETIYFNQISVW